MNSRTHSPDPPFKIPDHELIRCIGRGSYGEVWLARNIMGLFRAVKFVRRESFDNARPFERELAGIRRFEPVSRSHDGFVDVLHIGQNESMDSFYYVMELGDDRVSGQEIDPAKYAPNTLTHEISKGGKLSCQECLQLGLGLARALVALHKSGLVHRDIKPSNIIFVLSAPKLADIGLVAGIDEARSFVGTEGFIPPEGPGSAQADIFALGKVLYEAATGKDRLDFPELPTLLDQSPDHNGLLELNEVIIRACADATKRYRTAEEMHADLVLLANGKSLRRLKLLERRLANFKRAIRVSSLILALILLVGIQGYREWKNSIEMRERRVGESVAYGNGLMNSGNFLASLPHFAEALRLEQGNSDHEAAERLRVGCVLAHCPKLTHLWFADARVDYAQFSPDGNNVLIAEHFGKAKIYDLEARDAPPRILDAGPGLSSATYSPDARSILTASQDGIVTRVDAITFQRADTFQHPAGVYMASFAPDGESFITACADGKARVWDMLTRQLKYKPISVHSGPIMYAAFSPDGNWMITTGQDGLAVICDALTGQEMKNGRLKHVTWVTHAAFSPDSRLVVTACEDGIARVWERETGRRILPDLHHRDMLKFVEFSPDGRFILTSALDGIVRLWNAQNLEPASANPLLAHPERVIPGAFDSTGRRIVTACADGSIRVWDFAGSATTLPPLIRTYSLAGNRFFVVTNHSVRVFDSQSDSSVGPPIQPGADLVRVVTDPAGQALLTVCVGQTGGLATICFAQVWRAATGEAMSSRFLISNSFTTLSLSDDGERFAISGSGRAQLTHVASGKSLLLGLSGNQDTSGLLFSPDRRHLATWAAKGVQLWDADTGKLVFPSFDLPAPVSSVQFSADGSLLAACCADDQVNKCFAQVWSTATGKPIGPRLWHGDGVLCAAFSADGKRLLTGGEDSMAIVWNIATGKQASPSIRHPGSVQAVAFSHDGKWIATICADGAARIWNAASGDPMGPPLRHLADPTWVTFLGDNHHIVTADHDGRAWRWNLPAEKGPVEDLVLLARFLAGDSLNSPGDSSPQKPAAVKAIWERLRTNYAAAFTVSSNQVSRWHELQARESEENKQWSAATFHWRELLKLRPNDPDFRQHLKDDERKLQEANPADE